MNVQEALEYIHSVSWKGSVPGLSRTRELLKRMGNPEKKLHFIHIVGTNGKGSTAAMLASIFRQAGYVTGLYTSPFISCFNERMQVNGEMISDSELAEITEYVKPFAEACTETPTEFELVTCIAMEYFARHGCDIVSLEAGMGGALDSTNVIDTPDCAVITNVGLDHTEYLGKTLEEIATTKSGIFKEGGTCVTYPATTGVEEIYDRITEERHLELHRADFSLIRPISHSLEGQVFDYGEHKKLHIPLIGTNQLHNAAVVLTVAGCMKAKGWRLSEEDIRLGLEKVSWPGRFEVIGHDPLFIVDGGHNPQCIEALTENLQSYLPGKKMIILTGVMADKEYTVMYEMLGPFAERFVTVTPSNPRALQSDELARQLNAQGFMAESAGTVTKGIDRVIELSSGMKEKTGECSPILACGSLYMVGDIRAYVRELGI